MSLDRRSLLKQFLFISAGSALLPSCMQHGPKSSIRTVNFEIDGNQEELLRQLSEAILPTTGILRPADAPYAFALIMLDDCYGPDEQKKFLNGLDRLDDASKEIHGDRFVRLTPAKKEEFLNGIETNYIMGQDISYCYKELKRLVVQAYTTSPYFMTKVQVYELIPGRWHGCVPVASIHSKTVA